MYADELFKVQIVMTTQLVDEVEFVVSGRRPKMKQAGSSNMLLLLPEQFAETSKPSQQIALLRSKLANRTTKPSFHRLLLRTVLRANYGHS